MVRLEQRLDDRDSELGYRFDDLDRETHDSALANAGIHWLGQQKWAGDARPLIMINHPSRSRARSTDLIADINRLREESDLVVGFSGAAMW